MRKLLSNASLLLVAAVGAAVLSSCATAPAAGTTDARATESAPQPLVDGFGDAWSSAEVRIEPGDGQDQEGDTVVAGFTCVWTDEQEAGVVYPKRFIATETGEEVAMEFTWDSGGEIAAGVYDVFVDVDGNCGNGWIRNLPLRGAGRLDVVIDLNGCQFQMDFDTYQEVVVYPSGTHEDFKSRNMLDSIPEDRAVTWYNDENRGIWAVAPSGTFDLRVRYADDTVEWLQDYELPADARVTEL